MDSPLRSQGCGPVARNSSVLELPALERTLLWSIRAWAAYHDEPQSVWCHLERVFDQAGIRPALEPFAQLMTSLFASTCRLPDIRCVRCLRLGKDEGELLAVMALVTHDYEPESLVLMRLRKLMSPAAARIGAAAILTMMRVIGQAGLSMAREKDNPIPGSWPPTYLGHCGHHGMLSSKPH
jgi:hypothetical protein